MGCRGGALIELVGRIRWYGVDINPEALEVARASGIPCAEMDFTAGIAIRDEAFDAIMMTEVWSICLILRLRFARCIGS